MIFSLVFSYLVDWHYLTLLIITFLVILLLRPIVSYKYSELFNAFEEIDERAYYPYGLYSIQGRREYMEDRCDVQSYLNGVKEHTFYGLFDGHGGYTAAEFCKNYLCKNILKRLEHTTITDALKEGFVATDNDYLAKAATEHLDDGATAIAVLALKEKLYVANAGDSRAVLVKKDGSVEPLSDDHKPNRPDERTRITQAGGLVIFWGVWRVAGILAISRSIGDRRLKKFVISEPEIIEHTVTADDSRLVLATDGLWDVVNSSTVSSIVLQNPDVKVAAKALTELAYHNKSEDNISVLVIDLEQTLPKCPTSPTS